MHSVGGERFGGFGMSVTDRQRELVQTTWAQVEPISETAGMMFYGRLFELDPDVRPLFQTDMQEQSRKLVQMITVAVTGLNRLEQIVPSVRALGRRHADYGVRKEHYETVGAALLWTLDQGLGDDFTPEVREAWTETYALLAGVMKEAANGAP